MAWSLSAAVDTGTPEQHKCTVKWDLWSIVAQIWSLNCFNYPVHTTGFLLLCYFYEQNRSEYYELTFTPLYSCGFPTHGLSLWSADHRWSMRPWEVAHKVSGKKTCSISSSNCFPRSTREGGEWAHQHPQLALLVSHIALPCGLTNLIVFFMDRRGEGCIWSPMIPIFASVVCGLPNVGNHCSAVCSRTYGMPWKSAIPSQTLHHWLLREMRNIATSHHKAHFTGHYSRPGNN